MATPTRKPRKPNPARKTPENPSNGKPQPGPTRINPKEHIMPPYRMVTEAGKHSRRIKAAERRSRNDFD